MSRKKARTEATMGELWVMMATILAFQKANDLDPADYFREFLRDEKRLFRRIEAFLRDDENRPAIFAEVEEAAKQIGRGVTKQ